LLQVAALPKVSKYNPACAGALFIMMYCAWNVSD
jgi:hypothetical protein